MEFMKDISFARYMNLMFSLEENLTDSQVSGLGRITFEGLLRDVMARFAYERGWARFDYERQIFKARVWTSKPGDVIVLMFDPMTFDTQISGIDPDERRVRTFAEKLNDLLRMDITFDPMTLNFKFSFSALNKKK